MSENVEQSRDSPLIPSLPDDVILDIVARVPKSHYPTLTLVSKSFRKLIASPMLYERRSELGITQHRLYAIIHNPNTGDFSLYILHRKLNCSNRLVFVRPLPHMSFREKYVPVGSKVYVFDDLDSLSIDCTSHTHQPISNIPQQFSYKVFNAIGKKIYMIGDSGFHVGEVGRMPKTWKKVVTVFDTETQSWERKRVKENRSLGGFSTDSVVMEGKIYMKGYSKDGNFWVYEPEESKWEWMNGELNSKDWKGACVVDNVLYYLDYSGKALRAYDPKQGCWSVVNGLEDFLAMETPQWCDAVNYGEKKLALFYHKNDDGKEAFCCAEIALERRQGGEIWAQMESYDVVIENGLLEIMECVSVTV